MKIFYYITLAIFTICNPVCFSQGSTCQNAEPFCTQNGATFPASTNVTAQTGPNYGCLETIPNPAWYYLKIDQPGNINIKLTNSADIDIDFVCWGPYNSLTNVCSALTGSTSDCILFETYPCGNIIDCSYSTQTVETINIQNAQTGKYYIVLITNFDNQPTNIVATTTTGTTGSTNCNILVPCAISNVTATPSTCTASTNTYSVSGSVVFTNPPTTGTLTVTSSCGGTQTFNAPFTSPAVYTLNNLPANGSSCNITAKFSADAACTFSKSYTAPASCAVSPCTITNLNATIGACKTDNTFDVTGTLTYQNAPTTGTLTVTVTNSGGTQTQTFNAPFTNGQTVNFSIPGNNSNGSALTVTATFSANTSCTISTTGTSPASCACVADIGTFTTNASGTGTTPFKLCFGDAFSITSNDNYTGPAEITGSTGGPTYNPGVTWLIYSCSPSVALTPSLTDSITGDPCLLGVATDIDLIGTNNMSIINSLPAGTFTNNTVYFVPITMYSMQDLVYSFSSPMPCYELGTPVAMQFIPEILYVETQTCSTGTVSAKLTGGLPAVDGSNFQIVPGSITPANATIGTGSCANNGSVTITGLTSGQSYSFQVKDNNNCPKTISGTFTGGASISAGLDTAVCAGSQVTLSGTYPTGSQISWNNSVQNGVAFTPAATTTYELTVNDPDGCISKDQVTVAVNPIPNVSAGADINVCAGQTVTLTGNGATSYQWTNGVQDGVAFTPAINGVNEYVVTGTSTGSCKNTDTVLVNVTSGPTLTFEVNKDNGCAPLRVNFTNTSSVVTDQCSWNLGDGAILSGCAGVTYTYQQAGCFDVTLTSSVGGCTSSVTIDSMVCVDASPIADFSMSSTSVSELDPEIQFINGTIHGTSYLWNFHDGTTSILINPKHTFPTNNLDTTFEVMLVAFSEFGCVDTTYRIITVKEDVIYYIPNSFTPDGDAFNQTFHPVLKSGFDPYDYELTIFDRWGEKLFESHDVSIGWDGNYGGRLVSSGVYTWKIIFKENQNDNRHELMGFVTVLK
jgi:gliding motility-associated-like protein